MSATPLSTSIPCELYTELRAASAHTGIPQARIVADGLRMRLDQLAEQERSGRRTEPPRYVLADGTAPTARDLGRAVFAAGPDWSIPVGVVGAPERKGDTEVRICTNTECQARYLPTRRAPGFGTNCPLCEQPTTIAGHVVPIEPDPRVGDAPAFAPVAPVEWTGAIDGVVRYGVVMSVAGMMTHCTVDTFRGDPLHTVPVEVHRLRPRQPSRTCHPMCGRPELCTDTLLCNGCGRRTEQAPVEGIRQIRAAVDAAELNRAIRAGELGPSAQRDLEELRRAAVRVCGNDDCKHGNDVVTSEPTCSFCVVSTVLASHVASDSGPFAPVDPGREPWGPAR